MKHGRLIFVVNHPIIQNQHNNLFVLQFTSNIKEKKYDFFGYHSRWTSAFWLEDSFYYLTY